jgi:hypothetical protein
LKMNAREAWESLRRQVHGCRDPECSVCGDNARATRILDEHFADVEGGAVNLSRHLAMSLAEDDEFVGHAATVQAYEERIDWALAAWEMLARIMRPVSGSAVRDAIAEDHKRTGGSQ